MTDRDSWKKPNHNDDDDDNYGFRLNHDDDVDENDELVQWGIAL